MESVPCPDAEHVHHAREVRDHVRKFSWLASWPMHAAAAIGLILAFLVALAEYRWSPGGAYFVDPTIADALFFGFFVLWIFERPLRNKADRSPAMPMFRSSLKNGNRFSSAKVEIGAALAAMVIAVIFTGGHLTTAWGLLLVWLWIGIGSLSEGIQEGRWWNVVFGLFFLIDGFNQIDSFGKGGFHDIFTGTLFVFALFEAGLAFWTWRGWKEETARLESILPTG